MMNAAISTFGQGHQVAQERRLKAIEIVWHEISKIRSKVMIFGLFFTNELWESHDSWEFKFLQSVLTESARKDFENLFNESYNSTFAAT